MNLSWWLERSCWDCIATFERWKRPRLYVLVDQVPRTPAKRSKMAVAMRAQIEGLTVADADGVTTLGALRKEVTA